MNLVQGDYIEFSLPQFAGGSFYSNGRYRKSSGSKYVGDKDFRGTIEKEWYDTNRRHWFSIRLPNGKLKRAQGKNLYSRVTLHSCGENHTTAATDKANRKKYHDEIL
jgi:hypothetical protein